MVGEVSRDRSGRSSYPVVRHPVEVGHVLYCSFDVQFEAKLSFKVLRLCEILDAFSVTAEK